jgi:uncharacterized cupredoxin-like copper-binding protein
VRRTHVLRAAPRPRGAVEDAFTADQPPGEIPDVKAGTTGTLTVTLLAGRCVMLCSVEEHYKAGMVGTLTVQ